MGVQQRNELCVPEDDIQEVEPLKEVKLEPRKEIIPRKDPDKFEVDQYDVYADYPDQECYDEQTYAEGTDSTHYGDVTSWVVTTPTGFACQECGKEFSYSKTAGGMLEKNTLEEFRKIALTA